MKLNEFSVELPSNRVRVGTSQRVQIYQRHDQIEQMLNDHPGLTDLRSPPTFINGDSAYVDNSARLIASAPNLGCFLYCLCFIPYDRRSLQIYTRFEIYTRSQPQVGLPEILVELDRLELTHPDVSRARRQFVLDSLDPAFWGQ